MNVLLVLKRSDGNSEMQEIGASAWHSQLYRALSSENLGEELHRTNIRHSINVGTFSFSCFPKSNLPGEASSLSSRVSDPTIN